MQGFSHCLINMFATPGGVMILAAADATLFFSLPFGIDAAVILLAARQHTLAWAVPLLAAGSSLLGAALTFWMGVTIGEQGLEGLDRYASPNRLKSGPSTLSRLVFEDFEISFAGQLVSFCAAFRARPVLTPMPCDKRARPRSFRRGPIARGRASRCVSTCVWGAVASQSRRKEDRPENQLGWCTRF
jgi:hypothetical protein